MNILPKAALAAALIASSFSIGTIAPTTAFAGQKVISGTASYYGKQFHGRRTANGETFNMNAMTAASKTLPFGTKVRVTNRNNGKSVVVRINDRGPYVGRRILDLSRGAATRIGMIGSGTAHVRIDVL